MGIKRTARISQAPQTTLIISKTLSKVSDGCLACRDNLDDSPKITGE